MEGGIAIIFEVWALEVLRVVLYDAFEENEVAEVDCAADSDGYLDCHLFVGNRYLGRAQRTTSKVVEASEKHFQSR